MSITNTFASKFVVGFVAVAMVFSFSFAQAQTTSELQAQIDALLAQIASLQGQLGGTSSSSSVCPYTWTRDLTQGSTGADVMKLQQFLNADAETRVAASGVGSAGQESSYYGALTGSAVAKFQTKYRSEILDPLGLVNATTYFGASSRAKANALCSTSNGGGSGSGSGSGSSALEGGAGSIEDVDYVTSLNNEEVGEDEEDAEIAGLEIESDGSDIEIVAVTLNFSDTGVTNNDDDLDEYAEEVSVWFEGEEIARVDADEFDDDSNYTKTVTLDSGAIIREGDTGELTVAVTGLSNIDSASTGDDWTVEFESVRFRDAQGSVITDSTTGDINDNTGRTFSFESFASAADTDMHITKGSDDINDARVIEVDDSDETDNVEIFAFNVEVEGDSDITIDDLRVSFTFSGTASANNDIFSTLRLVMDGEEVGSENATNATTLTFDDLDLDLDAGEEYEFVVEADVLETGAATYAVGDTVTTKIVTADRNAWDVEDESGEDLATGDRSGSATSEAHSFFENGISVKAVSTSSTKNDTDTIGTFKVVVDVTAFGEDQYIYNGADTASSSSSGFEYTIYEGGTATGTFYGTASDLVQSSADKDGSYYVIDEGTTERFTLTVTLDPTSTTRLYNIELDKVAFDPDGAADGTAVDDTRYTVPSSEDVETDAESLDAS